MKLSPLNIGVLACSSIASRQILPVLASHEEFSLRSVASRSEEKAVLVAKKFATSPCSYKELLADPSIEAVYVSVPIGLHAEWGRMVLESGKHLILEKTFTTDLASTRELIEIGRKRGLVVMEALAYVFHPMILGIYNISNRGEVGRLHHIEAHFGIPKRSIGDIRLEPSIGGGALLDMLVYPLSFCCNLLNYVPQKYDIVSVQDDGVNVDCRGCVQLSWPHSTAHITYGFGKMYRNEIAIEGEDGRLVADRVFTRPPDMTDGVVRMQQNDRLNVPMPAANAYELMLRHFHLRVRGVVNPGINEGEELLSRIELITNLQKALSIHE